MKNIIVLMASALLYTLPFVAHAQSSSSKNDTTKFLGGRGKIIFKNKNGERKAESVSIGSSRDSVRHTLETSWFGFDMGFNQYQDNTTYLGPKPIVPSSDRDQGFINGREAGDFDLRAGKSMQFNFTIVKQQLSLYKHYVNLVYGLTYDINNWRYKETIQWNKSSYDDPNDPLDYSGPNITKDTLLYKKNKLVTNYLQVPLLIKFETSPNHEKKNVYFSVGGYVGYLVRSHTKQIKTNPTSNGNQVVEYNKYKQFEDFNLNKFQMGAQAEIGYQGISLYFKRNLTPLTEFGTQQYPYSFGIRLIGL